MIKKGCEGKMQFPVAQTVNDGSLGASKWWAHVHASFISIQIATVKAVIW